MARTGENGEQPSDLAALAREVRMALIITDAALPLGGFADIPQLSSGFTVEDRIALRGIAFGHVLRELTRYAYTVRPDDVMAMMDGRVPEPPWPREGGGL